MIQELVVLFLTFAKIGAVTFGGGLAMLPILERELAEKRDWTNEDELLEYYAIAQTTPGSIAVNVATFIGFKRRGVLGGIFATLGVVFPSLVIITVIATFISNFSDIVWVQKALTGINVAVAALLTQAVLKFIRKSVKGLVGFLIFAVSFSLIFFFKVSTVWVIFGSAVIGIVVGTIRQAQGPEMKGR